MSDQAVRRLAAELAGLRREMRSLSQPQLAYSSVEGGAIHAYTSAGDLRGIWGVLPDGSSGTVAVNGTPPVQPSVPLLTTTVLGMLIRWDGKNADGTTLWAMDWSRMEVHVSSVDGFTPDATTLKGTIETPQGGVYGFHVDTYTALPFYVRLVARNTSGAASTPSAQVTGNVGMVITADIAPLSITTPLINYQAITTALIAPQAVTTTEIAPLSITTPLIAVDAVTATEIAPLTITAAELAAAAVTTAKIATDAITSDLIAANAVTSTEIADGSISTPKLIAGAVTAAKIAAGTITANEIAALTITAAQIAAGTITAAKLAADTITANEIAANAITSSELAANAVIAGKIAAGTIVANDIAAATITGAKIAANTITAGNIVADTITSSEIAANAITSSEIAANAVVAGKIAAGTIVANDIAAATITGAKIAANTIAAGNIVAGTITANEIAAGTITALQIAANTITAGKLVAGTITANEIAANTITAAKIAANTITAAQIAAGTITANEIAALTITAAKIAAGTITANEIAAGTITTAKLAATAIDGMTITGALFRTAASGKRLEISSSPTNKITAYSGHANELNQGYLSTDIDAFQGSPLLTISSGNIQVSGVTYALANIEMGGATDGLQSFVRVAAQFVALGSTVGTSGSSAPLTISTVGGNKYVSTGGAYLTQLSNATAGYLKANALVQSGPDQNMTGFVRLQPGTSGPRSGYIEFMGGGVDATNSFAQDYRQGYIGYSPTLNTTIDTGTIQYNAGTHAFTGAITVTGAVTNAGLNIPIARQNGYTQSISGAASVGPATISLGATFPTAPRVVQTQSGLPGGSGILIPKHSGVSTTGFDAYMYTGNGATTTATSVSVSWHALASSQ